jgi:uncharacterized protein
MLRWFHALMPKEERFFELFARHSHAVLAGAQALRAMMEGGEAVSTNCKTVIDREHDADDATPRCSSPCTALSSRRSTAAVSVT